MKEENELHGLNGWLVFVGLGIILSPFQILAQIYPVYSELFSGESWTILTTPGTEEYNSLWAPYLIGELAINCGMILAWIFVAFIFFQRKKCSQNGIQELLFSAWYSIL